MPQDLVKKDAPPGTELKKQSHSADSQVVMEKEPKHHINCECDKDSTYIFACKNGVRWFAENVIILKIKRQ